jgi:hypothetical protein
MMRQVDEMEEDMNGMDDYGVSNLKTLKFFISNSFQPITAI